MKLSIGICLFLFSLTTLRLFAQPAINLKAVNEYEISPADYGLISEDIVIETADNVKLFG